MSSRTGMGLQTLALAVVLSLSACASAGVQQTYIAPTFETITSETSVRSGEPPTHVITIVNRSTVSVTVFSVGLEGCENIKMSCDMRRSNLRVGPGQTAVALRVEPANPYQGFYYRFRFAWREDSSSNPIAGLRREADTSSTDRLRLLSREDIRRLAPRVARLRVDPESLVMTPGERIPITRVRALLVDNADSVLGWTNLVRFSGPMSGAITFIPPHIIARRPARGVFRFTLQPDLESLFSPNPGPEAELPVVAAYRIEANAPVFRGRALDADTRAPLRCASISVADTASNIVNHTTSDETGAFTVRAPRAGTYHLLVGLHGWWPFQTQPVTLAAREEKAEELFVRFTEQAISGRDSLSEYQRARPAAVSTAPIGARPSRGETPIVQGITIGGSESMPILGIISRVPAGTLWAQFVVDSAGRVDTSSVIVPPTTPASTRASLLAVLPRVRFTPARRSGTPVCEHVRMQVNFSPR